MPGIAVASGPRQTAIINAIVGPSEVDVYVDGALLAAGLDAMTASNPVTLGDRAEHDLVVFRSIPTPPAARSARSDTPLTARQLIGQPRAGAIAHPAGPSILRLSNTEANGPWYTFVYDMPNATACDPGSASLSFEGNSDVLTTIGSLGSAGVFSVGSGTTVSSREYTREVVVYGGASRGSTAFTKPYAFGSFDFGVVPITFAKDRFFMAYGVVGVSGATEFVVDCATGAIDSVRNATRNPVFPKSRYVALAPTRLFDTRRPGAPGMPVGKLAAGAQVDVPIVGQVGIPATGVTAVVLNVTATEASRPGFVTVWPTGAARPSTSNINLLTAGQTAPNLVTVPVGAGGAVSVFASGGVHVLADVAGYFVAADSATAGRFVSLTPDRLFDTREPGATAGPVGPNVSIRVPIAGTKGVPATGAGAVVLNVTGVGDSGPGFVTVFPGGTTRPEASNVNLAGRGDVTSNLVIVPLGADGSVEFFASDRAHIVADVFGYITGAGATSSTAGLFVPTSPLRVSDSRPGNLSPSDAQPFAGGEQRAIAIAQLGDVPGIGAAAVLANITGTQAAGPGFLTAWPAGGGVPGVSNVNLVTAGTTRPNAAIVPLGGPGDMSLFSSGGAHALVDVFGYFTS
jgi:hypothetical protein